MCWFFYVGFYGWRFWKFDFRWYIFVCRDLGFFVREKKGFGFGVDWCVYLGKFDNEVEGERDKGGWYSRYVGYDYDRCWKFLLKYVIVGCWERWDRLDISKGKNNIICGFFILFGI